MIGCPVEDEPFPWEEPFPLEARIRNTFLEGVPRPEAANRRASSFPPTRRTPYTRIVWAEPALETDHRSLSGVAKDAESEQPDEIFPGPATHEVSQPPGTATNFTLDWSRCRPLACSVQQVDRTSILDPLERRLPSQTLQDALDAQYGLHPSHLLWAGETRIMLRNLPCRCTPHEIESFITARGVSAKKWTLVMPAGSKGRNRGYAFIDITPGNLATAKELLNALWQQSIPTRVSHKSFELLPAAWAAMTAAHEEEQA